MFATLWVYDLPSKAQGGCRRNIPVGPVTLSWELGNVLIQCLYRTNNVVSGIRPTLDQATGTEVVLLI